MNFWPAARPPLTPKLNTEPTPLRQVLPAALVVRVGGQAGVADPRDPVVGFQPLGDRAGVGQVLVHPLRQRFDALQQLEGRLRGQRGPMSRSCSERSVVRKAYSPKLPHQETLP